MTIRSERVRVRRDRDGIISIVPDGAKTPAGAFAALLPVAGGLVTVNVRAPDTIPTALLAEVPDAAWWLPLVFGEEVAAAVVQLAVNIDLPEEEEFTVQASTAALTDASVKLALALWLHRWWPAPDGHAVPHLDEQLLELEIGALAWHCEPLLADTSLANTMLSTHAPALLNRIASGQNMVGGRVAELIERTLLDALEATVETASLANDLHQRLEEALDIVHAQAQIIGASRLSMESDLRVLLDEHGVEHRKHLDSSSPRASQHGVPVPALHASYTASGPILKGRCSVDWIQVPPRVLGSNENSIRWEVRQDSGDAWEIGVTVTAAPERASEDDLVLFARIYGQDEPLPLSIIELARKGANYTGTAYISPYPGTVQNPGANALDVDVYAERYVTAPRRGSRGTEGVRERREIKKFIAGRVQTAKSETSLEAHEKGTAAILAAEFAAAAG